jgi:hypothetical protein
MSKSRTVGFLSVLVALVAVLAIPATSQAWHTSQVRIKVTNAKPVFHGVLASKNESCERNRIVEVKKQRPGPNKWVGADSSSYNGAWSVDVNHNGMYAIKLLRSGSCGGDKVHYAVSVF